jgi:hypothetical protein
MRKKWSIISFIICLALVALSPLASASPDGLERVAEDKGFLSLAQDAPFQIISDYVFPGIQNEALATILAGLIGTLILFIFVWGISWLLVFRKKKSQEQAQ